MLNREALASVLLLASIVVFVGGWITYYARTALNQKVRHPRQASETVIPLRKLSRREIVQIAAGDRLFVLQTCTAAGLLLTASLALAGRFGGGVALDMGVGIVAFTALLGGIIFRDCVRPLWPMLRGCAFPYGVVFRYIDGAWQYVDDDWFVRLEEGTACALRAPELDFSKPLRYSAQLSVDNGGRAIKPMAYSVIRASCQSGKPYIGKIGYCPDLERWIAEHGGRII